MKNPRVALGPTSPRGQAAAARKKMEEAEKYAPGMSLDMPDEFEIPKDVLSKVGKQNPKKMAKGGTARSSASKRADGCAVRGKTRGKMV